MKKAYAKALDELAKDGWDVRLLSRKKPCPKDVVLRYAWLPKDVRSLLEEAEAIDSPDDKAWFNTSTSLAGESGAAFLWNQWELDSLAAAVDTFPKLQPGIREFWDQHFPVMMSVKSGYAYFAIQKTDLAIVQGEELEYEEVTQVTKSFSEFLAMLRTGDSRLSRWI